MNLRLTWRLSRSVSALPSTWEVMISLNNHHYHRLLNDIETTTPALRHMWGHLRWRVDVISPYPWVCHVIKELQNAKSTYNLYYKIEEQYMWQRVPLLDGTRLFEEEKMRPVWEFFQVDLSLLRARVNHPEASYVCILKLKLSVSRQGRSNLTVCPNCPMLILSRSRLKERNSYQTKPLPQGVPKKWFQNSLEIKSDRDHKNGALSRKINRPVVAGYQISGKERGHGWSDDFKR